jgi:hypothetical protein
MQTSSQSYFQFISPVDSLIIYVKALKIIPIYAVALGTFLTSGKFGPTSSINFYTKLINISE